MTDIIFQLIADADPEDLPRTLKRERAARAQEAREREAREREAKEREARELDRERTGFPREAGFPRDAGADDGASLRAEAYLARTPTPVMYGDDPMPAAVRRFDVPFFHLMMFFLKAVVAAVPLSCCSPFSCGSAARRSKRSSRNSSR